MAAIKLQHGMPENYLDKGINLIYFGDFHYQEKAPGKRTDDFHATEFRKAELIQELGRKHKVRAFIQSGDFLDKPRISDAFMQQILANWNFKQSVRNREDYENGLISKEEYADRSLEQIPIIGIVGNHEVFGGAIKNYNRTSLKTLNDMGFINLVGRKKPYLLTMENGRTVAISGQSYDLRLLQDPGNFQLKQKFGDVDIFMVHEALYDTTLGEGMNWMPISKVSAGTVADVTIAGHIHNGFGWVERDGRIFGNPGVPAQQSAASTELDRDIVVTLIHISEDCQVFIEDIVLDTPRSRDLFDLSSAEEDKEHEEQMERVREIIDSVERIADNNAIAIINKVASTEGVDKEVLELAVSKTEEVMEVSSPRVALDPNIDYRVVKVTLENFESHLYTEVDLPDGPEPTVLIGESSHGKSSILRAIYWCLENEGSSMDFIRRAPGVTRAAVTLERADGLKVTRFVEKKKTRAGSWKVAGNGWIVTEPNGNSYETNTQGLEQIQALFGLTYLMLDQKDSIGINFQKQEDPWFFIGLNSQQRAKVIGSIYGTQYILGGIKALESQRRSSETQKKVVTEDMAAITSELEPLASVENKMRLINRLSELGDDLDEKTRRSATLTQLTTDHSRAVIASDRVSDFLEQAESATVIKTDLAGYEKAVGERDTLAAFLTADSARRKEQALVEAQRDWGQPLNETAQVMKQLQAEEAKRQQLAKYEPVYTKGMRLLSNHLPVVDSAEEVRSLGQQVEELKTQETARVALTAFLAGQETLSHERNTLNNLVAAAPATIGEELSKLKTMVASHQALTAAIAELADARGRVDTADKFIAEAKAEAAQLQKAITDRRAELKYSNTLRVGPMVIYGAREVTIGEDTVQDSKLQNYQERLDALNRKVIQAETRLKDIKTRQEESEGKIRALGYEPETAKESLETLDKTISELEKTIESNLSRIEEIAAAMEV